MELKLIEREKSSIRVEITEPDDTLIYPLVSALLKDPDVTDAQYSTGHPQLDKPVLFVKTRKGSPSDAVKKAAEALAGEFRAAKDLLGKELKA